MGQPQPYYSAADIAPVLKVSVRAVQIRAEKENWTHVNRKVRGGLTKAFLFALLPKPVQTAIQLQEGQVQANETLPSPVCSGASPEALQIQTTAANRLLIVQTVLGHMGRGALQTNAIEVVAKQTGKSTASILRWVNKIKGLPENDWMYALAPKVKAQVPAREEKKKPEDLKGWQRKTMEARLAILQEWNQRASVMGANNAAHALIEEAQCNALPEHLKDLVAIANARGGSDGKRTLSRNTLYRWKKDAQSGLVALAPKEMTPSNLPAWAGLFMECYRKMSKPSVPEALETMADQAPPGFLIPSREQAYRFLQKVSVRDRNKGRMSPQQLRSIRGYIIRDDSDLMPTDIYVCDGHSFKARVAHPVHGGAFHPEVCAIIDVVSRAVVGWSAGLAESA
ncbi:MAG: hypothetical protein JEZ02_22025, partial [Desulfatibacillum sp.]|nr:hypothetical protein [Desulfatibacillum sp.]